MPGRRVYEDDIEKMKEPKRGGHTYKEIAGEFDVSLFTVSKCLGGIGRRTKITPEIIESMKEPRRGDHTRGNRRGARRIDANGK